MGKRDDPSGQSWSTFLRNHAPHSAAMDLFVVPSIGFGKYEGVGQFLTSPEARLSMIDVRMRDRDGRRFVGISDGHHRFAWMRDHGALAIPVIIPISQAREIKRLVGSKARICRVRM